MKKFLFTLCFGIFSFFCLKAQSLTFKKGVVMDSVLISKDASESFSLYLPTSFNTSQKWPIVFVYDVNGKSRQAMSMFIAPAEKLGYVLVAPNHVHDTIATTQNIIAANKVFNAVFSIIPVNKNRVYTAGFSNGARLASTMPLFIPEIDGVISCGANIRNIELLNYKNPFYFIGVVGTKDYNYPEMLQLNKELGKKGLPNQLLKFDGGHEWPSIKILEEALQIFTISAMAKKALETDEIFIENQYAKDLEEYTRLYNTGRLIMANAHLGKVIDVYRPLVNTDSLMQLKRKLKKSKEYRTMNRNEAAALFKEALIKEDYGYSLQEDVSAYNYNNLGWWNYQMEELKKYQDNKILSINQMGTRLHSYVNALIEDNIDLVQTGAEVDEEALKFLWMLKTITEPDNFNYYLKVVSNSAKMEDYGTALFYLEEALKRGYNNTDEIYSLEHTVLLRITPEFNNLVNKYLQTARYNILEE